MVINFGEMAFIMGKPYLSILPEMRVEHSGQYGELPSPRMIKYSFEHRPHFVSTSSAIFPSSSHGSGSIQSPGHVIGLVLRAVRAVQAGDHPRFGNDKV